MCLNIAFVWIRCGQNFFDATCLEKFDQYHQGLLEKYYNLENQQRKTSLLTPLVQKKVKERLKPIHLKLKPAINTKDQGNWRRYKCQVYYGSVVSRLVQEVLKKEMNQFSYGLVVPEDIDVAVDQKNSELTF